MQVVQLCRDYGWTYGQYLDQPTWLIHMALEQMRIDGIRHKRELNQMKRGQ